MHWKIHKLDTEGIVSPQTGQPLTIFYAWGANDHGQIIGVAEDETLSFGVPLLWNPLPRGGRAGRSRCFPRIRSIRATSPSA